MTKLITSICLLCLAAVLVLGGLIFFEPTVRASVLNYLGTETETQNSTNGKSAYDLAVENGFEGTVEDWLDSLKGTSGQNGTDGQDGSNGIDGLNGQDGKDGVDGQNGFDGKDGENGIDGLNGVDGTNGIDGKDGTNGANGVDGKDGINGKDGADGVNEISNMAKVMQATAGSLLNAYSETGEQFDFYIVSIKNDDFDFVAIVQANTNSTSRVYLPANSQPQSHYIAINFVSNSSGLLITIDASRVYTNASTRTYNYAVFGIGGTV